MSIWGRALRVSTFGESHGIAVGCVIDGLPPNVKVDREDIQVQLTRRRPGQSSLTTARNEADQVQILSGLEGGVTLGTPIALMVKNEDQRKFDYANTAVAPRPGHADLAYRLKYGIGSSSGGGRASARETIARVAAGALVEKWLKLQYGTAIVSWVVSVCEVEIPNEVAKRFEKQPPTRQDVDDNGVIYILSDGVLVDVDGNCYSEDDGSPIPKVSHCDEPDRSAVYTRCPHPPTAARMAALIRKARLEGDSLGGVAACAISRVPVGLGEPCFEKTEAELAKAMLSLPAVKGFEIGSGFSGTKMKGSEHNDRFCGTSGRDSRILLSDTNHAGGTLGGITSGQDIVFRVAVKPVSSISKEQQTLDYLGKPHTLEVKGRHDPCVLPRTPPVVEGMAALVIGDLVLLQAARAGVAELQVA